MDIIGPRVQAKENGKRLLNWAQYKYLQKNYLRIFS